MKLHHIGVAVESIAKSLKEYSYLGYQKEGEVTWDKARNINILFITNGSSRLELVETADTSKTSPVAKLTGGY